jgi:DNA invertase Pin-like site-specific DNA recombinase
LVAKPPLAVLWIVRFFLLGRQKVERENRRAEGTGKESFEHIYDSGASHKQMLHSLAAQVSYYSDYVQSHPGWVYAGVYADEALTGTKDTRPEFRRLLADCRSKRIDLVITKSISRFARNTVHLLETVRELKLLGVDVFFEEQNIHTMSGDGELLLTILASYAQEESRSVSENCKWRIRSSFRNGELANLRFMYGYEIVKDEVEIVPEQAAIVRMIFDDYLSGLGCRRIVKKLKAMGVAKPRGGQWTSARVMGIIKNEKYAGDALLQKKYVKDHLTKQLVYNRGELAMYFAEGTHPAIIDKATFESAQALLRKRHAEFNVKCKPRPRYPFTGIIQCTNCGKTYKRRVNAGGAAWRCSTYCRKANLPAMLSEYQSQCYMH